ncbi:hypothetical protein HanPSC8_Chr03g0092151 [Helianthus annuus]|uniref:serine/threonine-protein kinase STY46 isoform X1 n=1 Tax=Helianthus annuus TaxID=4232 RepID=UPI000B90244C|nr:serine/threonine-protein kinase STY46 isoform X1 [Helianthus annuus]XP_022028131.1 serine/threonine-protein kinase STY46 isoform X1 [Helianthus annuus]XP_022028132.1 serine/threonine-protein kinase STY46 isoform X1 [Helianthus annuus]XP_022028133.1 serine/threonine-protein kinase STY46 isoform X1 [Helianthus annuus]XP_022028134.1 serine/threonine-protein kinase STY46 isoform X1 [Helianthus annuus]XP_035843757.1 serine/threonine-protein kinase STY46 isoform X1 [Helianthus annuus]KAJ0599386.
MHQWLLHLAHDPANRPVFEVRLVQVSATTDGSSDDVVYSSSPTQQPANSIHHPPPAFGSSPNLEALAVEANESQIQNGDSAVNSYSTLPRPMHEITFSTDDKPKLLSQVLICFSKNKHQSEGICIYINFLLSRLIVVNSGYNALCSYLGHSDQ